jgi:serine/threonine-protein kinase HipA
MKKSKLVHEASSRNKAIAVHADWEAGKPPFKLGTLWAYPATGRETFEFEFDEQALAHPDLLACSLDPNLKLVPGRQHCMNGVSNFGMFLDSSPDRWGRLLMKRRLEREQRKGIVPPERRLVESDFLLGVHDDFRVGALRFRLDDKGDFLDNANDRAAPPMVQLRELEQASLAMERDPDNDSGAVDEWLRLLLAPGGSLGGARPKASVVDAERRLWIAKFPSIKDEWDIGAWELLVHTLAKACDIRVPRARIQEFSGDDHTFLVERFDRTPEQTRLHFASAMTLTDHQDGEDASTGSSYLEIAQVLIEQGSQTEADLKELWTRIVFNMHVSNTDDHLRNHGFILEPGRGWKLSPAYDMNPTPEGGGLKLNVSEHDNAQDVDLALAVSPIFRLELDEARQITAKIKSVTRQWRALAQRLRIPAREQDQMAHAFYLADHP